MADAPRGRIVLVTGGARSGKSSFVLREAEGLPGKRAFIATAVPTDEEMAERIRRHKEGRRGDWSVVEEPRNLPGALSGAASDHEVIVIDCLTLWLSNILCAGSDIEKETEALISALKEARYRAQVFVVSNEVGMGIVPANELARRFRDDAGRLNRKVAEVADTVYMTVAGIAVKIRDGACI